MAEIILPPEEDNEITPPDLPELNIDKPTENSKVITIEFEAKKTNKVSTKDTNQQLYTTDTDAWLEFKETSLESANGTYSVVFRNRHDGSIFQRTGDVVGGVAYYKIPHQEIRHAGPWRGQLVYTLENGNTTAREFDYDVKGHMLDGKDVREIVVEDFETLMSQLRSMKESAEVELADLAQKLRSTTDTAEQNETDRQAFFDELVEDINEFEENERQRQTNEQGRESAESERVANEEERISNESERIESEVARKEEMEKARYSRFSNHTYSEIGERLDEGEERLGIIEEDVIVKATNSVRNGDFSNATYGWMTHDSSVNTTASGAEVVAKGNSYYPRILTNVENIPIGNVLYGAATYYFDDVSNITAVRIQSSNHNFSDELALKRDLAPKTLIRVSGVGKVITSAGIVTVAIEVRDPKVPTTYQVGSVLLIDLTETFGSGNEPTTEQMDKLLEQFPNSWFDGTVNIYNSKHMMVMFFNELTELNNAITTLGGNV